MFNNDDRTGGKGSAWRLGAVINSRIFSMPAKHRCSARNQQNLDFLANLRSRNGALLYEHLYLSSKYQLWLDNVLAAGGQHRGYDRLYIPRIGYTTWDIDLHDIAVDKNHQIITLWRANNSRSAKTNGFRFSNGRNCSLSYVGIFTADGIFGNVYRRW